MKFRLCNAPATLERCMMSMFSDLVEEAMEIFMDDFSPRIEFRFELRKIQFHGNIRYFLGE